MDNLFLKKVPVYFGTEKVQLLATSDVDSDSDSDSSDTAEATGTITGVSDVAAAAMRQNGFRKQRRMGQAFRKNNDRRRKA